MRTARAPEGEGGNGQGDLFGTAPVRPKPPAGSQAASPLAPAPAPEVPVPSPAPPRPERAVLTVGQLTRQLKASLEAGFPRVCVRGEVSGFRGPNVRGHLYFSLKDADACLDTRVWASLAQRMKFKLRDGMEVIAEGSIDLYAPQGRYSLIVQRIEPAGEGALALAFQQLKERLAAQGLFGEKRTRPVRPLPALPRRVGVVTSVTGAALRDFLRVLHARHPDLPVLVADARVQGEGAAQEIARGIARLARTDVDVIVVTRGGGSIEDLWAFNEEAVARAIFASPVPVVSAVGHEVDFTISDFVADLRAPTPSAAAEAIAPVKRELHLALLTARSRLRKAAERAVLEDRQRLARLARRLEDPRRALGQRRLHLSALAERMATAVRKEVRAGREAQKALAERLGRMHPRARLSAHQARVAKLHQRLEAAARQALAQRAQALGRLKVALAHGSPARRVKEAKGALGGVRGGLVSSQKARLSTEQRRLHGLAEKLDALSPLKVMRRGYSVTFRRGGGVIRSAREVAVGDEVAIRLSPGRGQSLADCEEIDARVTGIKPST